MKRSPFFSAHLDDIPKSTPPKQLFKYRVINDYTEKIFTKQELYFAAPKDFNDPFDCAFHLPCQGDGAREVIASVAFQAARRTRPQWTLEKAFEEAEKAATTIVTKHHEEASRQLSKSLARDYNDRVGILSLTATANNTLMWTHYADNHKGICLEFRTTEESLFRRAQPVNYAEDFPHLDVFRLANDNDFREATPWILTKSSGWSYEHEWRVLDFENGPGVQIFPPECLSAVILGCRIPEAEREKVMSWVKSFPTPVRVLRSKISDASFRLHVVDGPDLE